MNTAVQKVANGMPKDAAPLLTAATVEGCREAAKKMAAPISSTLVTLICPGIKRRLLLYDNVNIVLKRKKSQRDREKQVAE